jgi:ribosomal subunit interface protein
VYRAEAFECFRRRLSRFKKGEPPLKVLITDRVGNIPQQVKDYAEEKAGNLERYFDGTLKAEVIFKAEGQKPKAEMIVTAKRGTRLYAEATGDSYQAVLDMLMDKIERQISKTKDRIRKEKRHSAGSHPLAVGAGEPCKVEEGEEEEVTYDEIVEETDNK